VLELEVFRPNEFDDGIGRGFDRDRRQFRGDFGAGDRLDQARSAPGWCLAPIRPVAPTTTIFPTAVITEDPDTRHVVFFAGMPRRHPRQGPDKGARRWVKAKPLR
jgi:hypothetical protein